MLSNKKAFTLVEIMVSSTLLIVVLTAALTSFILVKNVLAASIIQAAFQRDAEVLMSKILEGRGVSGGIRLSETRSVIFHADTGKLTFIGPDGVISRMYFLSGNRSALLYSEENGIQNKVLYAVQPGAIITLIFSPMNVGPPLCTSVYVSVSQVINGRTAIGALESSVYLRNHPV